MSAISQGVQSGRGSNRSARSPPVTASALTTWFVPAYQGQWSSVFLILACISKPRCFRPPCKTRQGYYHKCMGSELNRRANSQGGKIKTKIHKKTPFCLLFSCACRICSFSELPGSHCRWRPDRHICVAPLGAAGLIGGACNRL